jgi:hypothetical protein
MLRERLDALGRARRAELLHVLMLPDFERADRIGEFWGYPESRTFAELLIDCKEDRALRAVLVGMLSGARAVTYYDGNGRFTEAAAIGTLGRRVAAAGPPPLLLMRYDRVNLNVHSVLEQLRSNEPLAPT